MRKIAFTFDDGPGPDTSSLLIVLANHGVKATFFMVGERIDRFSDVVLTANCAGHFIGNHTMTHPKLPQLPILEAAMEIERCEQALTGLVGSHSGFFRPPFVETTPEIEDIVSRWGLTTVFWKAAGADGFEIQTPQFIYDKVLRELNGGDGIILLHDGYYADINASRATTVEAVDRLITHFKEEGCEFVSPLDLNPQERPW